MTTLFELTLGARKAGACQFVQGRVGMVLSFDRLCALVVHPSLGQRLLARDRLAVLQRHLRGLHRTPGGADVPALWRLHD